MASEADQKIRRVAIVLQSMDSATARKLLAQFPDPIARDVRRAMANLGTVSQAERAAAMSELQGLMAPNATPRPPTNDAVASRSPAVQLLSQATSFQDTIQLSPAAIHSSESLSSSQPIRPSSSYPIQPATGNSWVDVPPAFLAHLLQQERAIVIAAVINELPVTLATPVLQHLPVNIATETMAILPSLHRTDPMILQELLEQMKSKVSEAMQSQKQYETGLDKLRAIVANVPNDQRGLWASALGSVDPLLSSKLGWGASQPTLATLQQLDSNDSLRHATDRSVHELSVEIERETIPMTAPSPAKEQSIQSDRKLSDLLALDDSELVQVLHAVDPQSVLLALSNADRKVLHRIERLIPKRDLRRFRERLGQLRNLSIREIDAACVEILDTAARMVPADGVTSTRQKTFSAAA